MHVNKTLAEAFLYSAAWVLTFPAGLDFVIYLLIL